MKVASWPPVTPGPMVTCGMHIHKPPNPTGARIKGTLKQGIRKHRNTKGNHTTRAIQPHTTRKQPNSIASLFICTLQQHVPRKKAKTPWEPALGAHDNGNLKGFRVTPHMTESWRWRLKQLHAITAANATTTRVPIRDAHRSGRACSA